MKNKFFISMVLVLIVLGLSSCNKNSNTVTGPTISSGSIVLSANYFPNSDGSNYKYSITGTNSNKSNVSGTKVIWYNGYSTLEGVVYQKEIDTVSVSSIPSVLTSFFIKTSSGVIFAFDTSGLSNIIPDTLMKYISFSPTLNILDFTQKTWNVFTVDLKYGVFPVIHLLNVSAASIDTENVVLNLGSNTQTVSAAKVQFTITLNIPNPSNILSLKTYSYIAYAWLAPNIGIIKWQGSGALLEVLSGQGINFSDTTASYTQSLISYSIK
jgi:hypothetical protein